MRARLRSLFLWLAELCEARTESDPDPSDKDTSGRPYQGHEHRVAYRLAYQAALDWRDGSYTKLEAFRNRATGLLSGAVIVMGATGIGVTGVADESAKRGDLTWIGVFVAVAGFVLCLFAAGALMGRFEGAFVIEPERLVRNFGDNLGRYRSDDATYRAIALFGQQECSKLAEKVDRRCRWLYLSMVGFPVTVAGVVLVWADAI